MLELFFFFFLSYAFPTVDSLQKKWLCYVSEVYAGVWTNRNFDFIPRTVHLSVPFCNIILNVIVLDKSSFEKYKRL